MKTPKRPQSRKAQGQRHVVTARKAPQARTRLGTPGEGNDGDQGFETAIKGFCGQALVKGSTHSLGRFRAHG